jgi:hypothetical protein
MMRRPARTAWTVAGILIGLLGARTGAAQQRPDSAFIAALSVAQPAYSSGHPRVLVDEAHHNFHTMSGGYAAFAALLRSDGYDVGPLRARIAREALRGCRILVVANALGDSSMSSPRADQAAFDSLECEAADEWVRDGGSLLLIADHYPCGGAARPLAERFRVWLSDGIVGDPERFDPSGDPTWVVYTSAAGLAPDHPIIAGRDSTEQVRRVVTFTGESVLGPSDSVSLLTLGEAAMLTAQRDGSGARVGMNRTDTDDLRFARNVAHWLSGLLP